MAVVARFQCVFFLLVIVNVNVPWRFSPVILLLTPRSLCLLAVPPLLLRCLLVVRSCVLLSVDALSDAFLLTLSSSALFLILSSAILF